MPASGCKQRGKLVDKTKWKNKCCNDRLGIIKIKPKCNIISLL